MIKKIIKGVIVSTAIAILPVLGNMKMLVTIQIWIFFLLGILSSVLQPDYKIKQDKSNEKDKGTEIQIIWSVFITQLFVILEASYMRYPDSMKWDVLTSVFCIVMITGLLIRTWAVYTLGKYFTMHLNIRKDHKIIRSGPYQFVRHPSYVGAFLTYVGAPIFFHSWYALIACLIILPFAWYRRIHFEEKMLINNFKKDYEEYAKSVKRFIPGVW